MEGRTSPQGLPDRSEQGFLSTFLQPSPVPRDKRQSRNTKVLAESRAGFCFKNHTTLTWRWCKPRVGVSEHHHIGDAYHRRIARHRWPQDKTRCQAAVPCARRSAIGEPSRTALGRPIRLPWIVVAILRSHRFPLKNPTRAQNTPS